jgi:hypothetical protein
VTSPPGAEAASGAGQHDAADRRIVGAALERGDRAIDHRPRQRIQPLRAVHRQHGDAVARLEHQVVGWGGSHRRVSFRSLEVGRSQPLDACAEAYPAAAVRIRTRCGATRARQRKRRERFAVQREAGVGRDHETRRVDARHPVERALGTAQASQSRRP